MLLESERRTARRLSSATRAETVLQFDRCGVRRERGVRWEENCRWKDG